MKLNFSSLSNPAQKQVGHGGTGGTTSIDAGLQRPTNTETRWDIVGQSVKTGAGAQKMPHLSHQEKNEVGQHKASIHGVVPLVPPVPPKNDENRKCNASGYVAETDRVSGTIAYCWRITFEGGEQREVFIWPPANESHMRASYPEVTRLTPLLVLACTDCLHCKRPDTGAGYCTERNDLPYAYGTNHPVRYLPEDGGTSCEKWKPVTDGNKDTRTP